MKIRIEPYKTWSGGAKRLGRRAGILRATPSQIKRHGDFDIIINWGRSERRFNGKYINEPTRVDAASDKGQAVEIFKAHKVPQPSFTRDQKTVRKWLREGHDVLARTLLRASGGRGISIIPAGKNSDIPNALLYTRYVKKTDEYRVHVWQGEIIDVQQKRRNKDIPDGMVNWQIRNHDNGFIYARGDCNPPDCIRSAAISAVTACELDFGAVDLGYNVKSEAATVYEVNTAPGLEGTTLDKYYGAILRSFPAIQGGMYAKRRSIRR
jgi:glutathione synthase/RimK-type ligase-like ATP-grasp enzyme